MHLLEDEYFNPIVFCHDSTQFDRSRYIQIVIGFINLLSFLYSCKVTVDTEIEEPGELELFLYKRIMQNEEDAKGIRYYKLQEIDFTGFDIETARVPDNCEDKDFALVKIYLSMRSGTALNKKAMERLTNRKYTDSEMLTLRKQLMIITGREIIKRKDNSYEMR